MSSRMPRLLTPAGLAVTVVALVTACSQQPAEKSAAPSALPAASSKAAPSDAPPLEATATAVPTAIKTKTAKPPAPLTDGRHPGFIRKIGADSVSMDLVELVTGDAAVAELKKQNPGSDPEYSDNQYAVVNDNKKVRKLPLASSLVVKVLDDSSSEPQVTVELSAVPQHFDGRLDSTLFWFVVEQGAVTRIEELYKS